MVGKLRPRSKRGQAIVEFALIAPLAMLLILGGFDLSIMGTDTGLAVSAARQGARIGSELGGTNNLGASCTGTLDPATNSLSFVDQQIVQTILTATTNMSFMGGLSGKAPNGKPESIVIYRPTAADGTLSAGDHQDHYVFTDGFAGLQGGFTSYALTERCQGPLPNDAEIGIQLVWNYKPANGIPGPSFMFTNYAVERLALCSTNCR
ncbi:MAG: TadE/TadG family type IV pilus assembly protein [Candidatus Dormibacteria bacterium]